jgi:hypothetical protein
LIYQAAAIPSSGPKPNADQTNLIRKAEQSLAEIETLSGGRLKVDHVPLSLIYEKTFIVRSGLFSIARQEVGNSFLRVPAHAGGDVHIDTGFERLGEGQAVNLVE